MRTVNVKSLVRLTNAEVVNFVSQACDAAKLLPETIDQTYLVAVKDSKEKLESAIKADSTADYTRKLKKLLREMQFAWQMVCRFSGFDSGADGAQEVATVLDKYGDVKAMNVFAKRTNLTLLAHDLRTNHSGAVEALGVASLVDLILSKSEEFEVMYNERAALNQRLLGSVSAARKSLEESVYAFFHYVNAYEIVMKSDFSGFVAEIEDLYDKVRMLRVSKAKANAEAKASLVASVAGNESAGSAASTEEGADAPSEVNESTDEGADAPSEVNESTEEGADAPSEVNDDADGDEDCDADFALDDSDFGIDTEAEFGEA